MTRTLYGIYFFLGGCFKVLIGLLWSDVLQGMFIERLDEIPPHETADQLVAAKVQNINLQSRFGLQVVIRGSHPLD